MDFYFAQKTFFPKNLLPNSGCGLSTGAAYTRVNTVVPLVNNSLKSWNDFKLCSQGQELFLHILELLVSS